MAEFSRELPGGARQQAGRCELAPEQPAEMPQEMMAVMVGGAGNWPLQQEDMHVSVMSAHRLCAKMSGTTEFSGFVSVKGDGAFLYALSPRVNMELGRSCPVED